MRAGKLHAAILAVGLLMPVRAFAADDAQVKIDVTATVSERCGISRDAEGAPAVVPNLETAQSMRFGFDIDCNTPFVIGVSSENGALVLTSDAKPTTPQLASSVLDDGFASRKLYDVALAIDTDGDSIKTDTCSSADLTGGGRCAFYGREAGSGQSSGKRTAIRRKGAVLVSWQANDGKARRAAGLYRDTLTIVVGPRS